MNNIKTAALLALLSGLLMVIGQMVGGHSGMILMFIISLGVNFYTYWNSASMVLRAYDAKEITEQNNPNIFHIVKKLVHNAGLPMPKVYIIESEVPNAFATGRDPEHAAVAVTTGIMNLLTDDEIEGVLAHELSHVKHRDTLISTIAASMAGFIAMVANMLQWAAIFGGRDEEENSNPLALIGTIILAPLAASLIQMAISRSREYLADEEGAMMSRKPLSLASALAKIEHYAKFGVLPGQSESRVSSTAHMFIINPLSGISSTMTQLFSTHPSTESRIQRLREIASRI